MHRSPPPYHVPSPSSLVTVDDEQRVSSSPPAEPEDVSTSPPYPLSPEELQMRHQLGVCKPCTWAWRPEGCRRGVNCKFCHICEQGESKRRRKERIAELRAEKLTAKAGKARGKESDHSFATSSHCFPGKKGMQGMHKDKGHYEVGNSTAPSRAYHQGRPVFQEPPWHSQAVLPPSTRAQGLSSASSLNIAQLRPPSEVSAGGMQPLRAGFIHQDAAGANLLEQLQGLHTRHPLNFVTGAENLMKAQVGADFSSPLRLSF